jgi:uncharacterized protein YecT (DUF1311 family)
MSCQNLTLVRIIVTATLSMASIPLQAKSAVEARYSKEYNECMSSGDAANGVTSGVLDCIGAEIDRQDARLNQAYKMVMSRLNASRKTILRASERAWIGQRDARCRKASAPEKGGTLASIIYSGCILDETIKRIIFLEKYQG